MRVTPRSRRSRAPLIWFMLMVACGFGTFLAFNVLGDASRGFDVGADSTTNTFNQRVNVLLLGIDQREGMSDPARTDTMLVLTLDPQKHTAGMLSINRDLWVKIPGINQEGKINTAHFYGEVNHTPGGGPALAMLAVQSTFDIPLQYYVRLNFTAFEKLIDLIGGIDLYVPETIDDPNYPDAGFGYEPFHIDAGWHHLDGRTALKYARTRATPGSDLDRVKRQQQVIMTVRDKIMQDNLLPRLLTQIGPLLQTLQGSIQTNLTPGQLIELASIASKIDRGSIRTVTFDSSMVQPYFSPDGQEALTLKPGAIQQLRARLLDPIATPIPPAPTTAVIVAPTLAPLATRAPVPTMAVIAAPTLSPLATPELYTVQAGDTLFSLARVHGITVEAILQANNLTGDNIYIGQQLIIPAP